MKQTTFAFLIEIFSLFSDYPVNNIETKEENNNIDQKKFNLEYQNLILTN